MCSKDECQHFVIFPSEKCEDSVFNLSSKKKTYFSYRSIYFSERLECLHCILFPCIVIIRLLIRIIRIEQHVSNTYFTLKINSNDIEPPSCDSKIRNTKKKEPSKFRSCIILGYAIFCNIARERLEIVPVQPLQGVYSTQLQVSLLVSPF